ncbi:MAG TPA: hypothetical protein VEL75_02985, partial [Candidatus Methylomirabilis sp.]|nr:hypothetical protein [Candidatus Methylomirabilis sp.]
GVSPLPDIVALAATTTGNGIVDIPSTNGTGAFSVATVNVGANGFITVSADTAGAAMPLTVSVCQTNPNTAMCLSPPTPTVSLNILAGQSPTFGVFATASGPVPLLPGVNRVFVRFTDTTGVIRGSTSVAVQTQ